ncbi:hypothetical protein PILCRDRAFT_194547 [Piloderma croceum F 1598]|uniref:Uncharacterized protein n=1 Tax=Piloderma croceum (strain F 1598) TaxID=765440 RepID=A0A0C3CJ53_PILCF|nr:hypothetical protein PILCRDRAFT_194547 [Piloderma croceum F 1598]
MHHLSRPQYRHVGRSSYNPAGRAPPRFRSPTNTLSTLSTPTSTSIRRPLPPPPRNNDSSSVLSETDNNTVTAARLRSFEHHIPLKHDVKYTYAELPSFPNVVFFFEYRGYGFPSSTLGASGDIYIDITEHSYALYAKGVTDWARWTVGGWLEHPFLTDTVLGFLLDTVVWIHPMRVDRPSQAAELHYAIRDMLIHEADDGDDSDAVAAGNGSRKRPRVDEETSSTAHNSEPPSSPLSEPQVDEDLHRVDITPTKIPYSTSQAPHSASYQPRKKSMDTRISVLQQEMAKLQEDLRELQAKNARVTVTNEKLLDEVKTLQDENRGLKAQIGDHGKPVTTNHAPEASPIVRSRESGRDDALAGCAEPNDKSTLGRSAQSTDRMSDTESSTSGRLRADIQNRLKGHSNYFDSVVDEMVETHLNMQRAEATIADLKHQITTLSGEVQTHRDTCARTEAERKEQGELLQAIDTWLMHAPKRNQDRGG